jgi:RNA polymerase sigma-70 factor (ECF subfamily)
MARPPSNDHELLIRMANGSVQAARELYRRLSPLVYSLACKITGREEDAEEVLIDAFHQAWVQASRYDPSRATITGWILSITRSRAIDKFRAHQRWEQRKEDVASFSTSLSGVSAPTPEQEAIRSEERLRLQTIIDTLPQDQKRAVELAYFGGLSHSEIAEQLGQPIGTVKTRLRLAMQKLKDALMDGGGNDR